VQGDAVHMLFTSLALQTVNFLAANAFHCGRHQLTVATATPASIDQTTCQVGILIPIGRNATFLKIGVK